jgi:hypothetical protein
MGPFLTSVFAYVLYFMLQAGRSGNRIPVGAGFSLAVRTGPGAHPVSYTVGTVSFLGAKWRVDNPPHLAPRLKKEKSSTSTPFSALVFFSRANVYFTFYLYFMIEMWGSVLFVSWT